MFVLGKYGKLFGVTLLSTLVIVGCGGGDGGSESAGSSAISLVRWLSKVVLQLWTPLI